MLVVGGDVPITTFFPYKAPDGRKRKAEHQPVASSSSKKPNRGKSGMKTKVATLNSNSCGDRSKGYRVDSEISLNTPSTASHKNDKAILQTPPATVERSSHRLRKTRARVAATLPTPRTLPRPRLCTQPKSFWDVDDTPIKSGHNHCIATRSCNPNLHDDSGSLSAPHRNSSIPSSQNQDGSESYDSLSALSIPTPLHKDSPHHTIPPYADAQECETPPWEHRLLPSLSDDLDELVLSSQSQMLNPLDNSPRKERYATNATDLNTELDAEIIPSSQTHEIDAMTPSRGSSAHQDQNPLHFPSHGIPTGTMSDELFSAPINKNVLAGIFTNADRGEDSAANSDTESDEGDPDPRPLRGFCITRKSPSVTPPCQLLDNSSRQGNTSSQWQSQLSVSSSSSCGLPSPLRDFQDMFGSSDESYPPDFPMSLRL